MYSPSVGVTEPRFREELRRIAAAMRTVQIPKYAAEPENAPNGLIIYAVGDLATDLGAPGVYAREEGAWIKL